MMKKMNHPSARGFSLTECGLLVAVLALLVATVLPGLNKLRGDMHGAISAQNLMQFGQSAGSYGFFNQGKLFNYSWRAGETYMMPDGRYKTPLDDGDAASLQNEEILERLTGRVQFDGTQILSYIGRLPHRRYSHLVLIDYLGEELGDEKYIDPADANQLSWADNPLEYLEDDNTLPYGNGMPAQSGYDTNGRWTDRAIVQRWTFASSYQNVPSAWQQDSPSPRYIAVSETPHLYGTHGYPINLSTGRFIDEVAYPSNKVWMHEEFDREQALDPYFGYNHAQPEKLMFDGSVNSLASGEANPSIVPERGNFHWKQTYVPLDTFPLPLGGLGDDTLVSQRYRWTFRGLSGFDYGPAVPGNGIRPLDNDTIPAARAPVGEDGSALRHGGRERR